MPSVIESHPESHLVLFGSDKQRLNDQPGPYESELRLLVNRLQISDNVHFVGFRLNANRYVAQFDVAVLCSRREAQGLAAVEALAAGVPLVATRIEGLQEVVVDGVTGVLVQPDDPKGLSDAILRVLSDSELKRTISVAAPLDVRDRFNASDKAATNLSVYESLIASRLSADTEPIHVASVPTVYVTRSSWTCTKYPSSSFVSRIFKGRVCVIDSL